MRSSKHWVGKSPGFSRKLFSCCSEIIFSLSSIDAQLSCISSAELQRIAHHRLFTQSSSYCTGTITVLHFRNSGSDRNDEFDHDGDDETSRIFVTSCRSITGLRVSSHECMTCLHRAVNQILARALRGTHRGENSRPAIPRPPIHGNRARSRSSYPCLGSYNLSPSVLSVPVNLVLPAMDLGVSNPVCRTCVAMGRWRSLRGDLSILHHT